MAVLPDGDRESLWAEFMRDLGRRNEIVGSATINKNQLRDAVNAIDGWVDSNTSSFNTAIPEPARTQLSAKQKAGLLAEIVKRRWEVT